MNITFLDIFDQFRFILGTIFAEVIFVTHITEKRNNFLLRFIMGIISCMVLSLTYFPLINLTESLMVSGIAGGIWWFLASWISMLFILFCYEISFGNAMFQCIFGLTVQQVVTIILRYYIVEMKFPEFPENHTLMYCVMTVLIYLLSYTLCFFLVKNRNHSVKYTGFLDSKKMICLYGTIFAAYSLLTDITAGMFEWIMIKQHEYPEISMLINALQYFLIVILLVVSIVIFIIMFSVYEVNTLKQEKELLERLQKEKKKQYAYTKENIDIINQKCHDLKHQIAALELVGDAERKKLIQETKEAVHIYDSVVKTDNEVLNTILSEKSLICNNHNIRLSCTVNSAELQNIAIIDLYTILGNAIDNAIECVMRYQENEKKVISINIQEKGRILSILVDNFFDGELELEGDLPVTSKINKIYHGYGIKGIQITARKYGGDIRISRANDTFSIQIMIPLI